MGHYNDIAGQFASGTAEGVKALFDHYGQKLYGFARAHFRLDEDRAVEALYKTLETVGRLIPRQVFVSDNHFENWLFKIHKNNVLQELRSRKAEQKKTFGFEEWASEAESGGEIAGTLEPYRQVIELLSSSGIFANGALHQRLMDALEKALGQLSETERDLLLLRMSGYTYAEIGDILEVDAQNLKVKFLRSKAKITRKTLEHLKKEIDEYPTRH